MPGYVYRGTIRDAEPEPAPAPKVKRGPGRPRNPHPAPCGTPSAYARHKRLGEPVDLACRIANAAACKKRRDNNPKKPPYVHEYSPCGTRAAYVRHRRKGEPIDDTCRLAHNERNRAWKAKKAAA
jgi:hypothetical protein